MIDERLDQRIQDLNRRYQELMHSKPIEDQIKRARYAESLKNLNLGKIIRDLRYRRYAKNNFSDAGNLFLGNRFEQDVREMKIAVYSCIIGRYDTIIEPVLVEPEVDYYMITDQFIPESSTWKKIDATKLEDYGRMSNMMLNRKIKILQTEQLRKYDYSIYIDGNIEIIAGMSPIIAQMKTYQIGLHFHRSRDCIYDEVVAVKHLKQIQGKEMDAQVNEYKKKGFPKHYGLYENSIIVRDNRSNDMIKLMEAWWDELCLHPTRDQLSLPYVVWKQGYNKENIFIMGNDLERNTRFNRIQKHL